MPLPRLRILLVVAALVAGACGGGGDDDTSSETTTSTTGGPPAAPAGPPTQQQLDGLNVQWTHIATAKFPTVVTHRQGALYVGEREGTVRAIKDGKPVDPPALDIASEVGTTGEGGFLGLAFSPDGTTMYVSYTDNKTDSRVAAYTMAGERADPASRRELLFVDQPASVHNGGNLVVDGKGLLWVSFGDGGVRTPTGRQAAQDLGNLLGTIVRIDPKPSGGKPYTVPADNPYVGRAGALPEIYAYGLRNPWRFSLDRATGDLWIGDVGEANAEEIDLLAASAKGANFGWPAFEGAVRFTGSPPADHVPPLKSIARSKTFCAVTGGYVYRGKAIPDLVGTYVYGELCGGNVSLLSQKDGKVVAERPLGVLLDQLVSFGEDADGELYAMSLVGQIWKLTPG
ncbi:MAG TPA: PQQ-dependent sugar dehydrogenase [Acidimicrobiales bacterium]|nr:PQQ-dependent sugar dehydrogenase [Acidimicrobiales bacterium]